MATKWLQQPQESHLHGSMFKEQVFKFLINGEFFFLLRFPPCKGISAYQPGLSYPWEGGMIYLTGKFKRVTGNA